MKICILSDEHYPHTGADTIVIVNTAAALGAAGADVELMVPRLWRGQRSAEDIMDHYGVGATFRLTRIPSWPPPERKLRLEKLAHGLAGPLVATLKKADVIHSRDLLPLLVAHATGRPWSFETYRRHAEEKPWLPGVTRRLGLHRAVGAVAHSRASADSLEQLGFSPDAVLVARPGFDPERFEPRLERSAAREALGLPADRPLVVYVGNVGPSKGTDEITDLAARIPEARFLVVGGADAAVEALKKDLGAAGVTNVILAGHQPPGRVAPYLFAADVLFVPAIYHNAYAGALAGLLRIRTLPGTPLKLYGYLAAGRPIVSADQPHTRDLLAHEETAVMVPPGDGDATAAAIRRVLGDAALSRRLSRSALTTARELTWENRGKKMLAFFERRLALINGGS
jgi:glycosyltransferase involved in cell wall biosynthesis